MTSNTDADALTKIFRKGVYATIRQAQELSFMAQTFPTAALRVVEEMRKELRQVRAGKPDDAQSNASAMLVLAYLDFIRTFAKKGLVEAEGYDDKEE